ncbi:MAG: sel1 repeat family protein [Rhodobacteraceae bacterium]|nr:sel1 repeat family protein [Paracoccaceae bacterium]
MLKYLIIAVLSLSGISAKAQYAPENEAGLAAARGGDMQAAWDIWKPLADVGDARAQSNIGVMYDNGDIVAEDDTEAVRWFTLSAEGGFDQGQFNLAQKYGEGAGVAQNWTIAIGWYQAAARQGHPYAQMALMQAYYFGNGATPDPAKAYMWMTIAAETGFATAVDNLADFEARVGKEAVAQGREMAVKCISAGLEDCP